MPGISSSIRITDFASGVVNRIGNRVSQLVERMEQLEQSSNEMAERGLGLTDVTPVIEHAREELEETERIIDEISETAERLREVTDRTGDSTAENAEENRRVGAEIHRSRSRQEELNNSIRRGGSEASNLLAMFKRVVFSLGTLTSLKKLMDFSDNQVLIRARLDVANSGNDTIEEFEKKIMRSAKSARSEYSKVADVVAKLGITANKAFTGNDEIIKFTELMSKSFKIAGAGVQEQSAGMYQLTQAMASGRLQGDEFRSIIENAPLLAQAIAKYTNVSQAELKKMSSEGLITSDIIKNALFSTADEIEERYKKMPVTFADIWTSMKNTAIITLEPISRAMSSIAQNEEMQRSMTRLVEGFRAGAVLMSYALIGIAAAVKFTIDMFERFKPIVIAVISLFVLYKAVVMALAIANGLLTLSHTAQATAIALLMGAQTADIAVVHGLTHAYTGLNTVLLACPIFWIPAVIILVITLFHYLIKAINHFAGTSISSIGIVTGIFNVFFNTFFNQIKWFYNITATVAEFFANVWRNPLHAAKMLFVNFANSVIGIIKTIAGTIDAVFGSNLYGVLGGFQSKLQAWGDKGKPDNYKSIKKMEYTSDVDAYKKGYNFGSNLQFGKKQSLAGDMLKGYNPHTSLLANIADNTKGGMDNTGKINDTLNKSNEDLKLLRELAQKEVIDRTLIREVSVNIHNKFGDIRETADVDGLINHITARLEEELSLGGEGVA